jgi:dolichol-phosphate mannosyltransferase
VLALPQAVAAAVVLGRLARGRRRRPPLTTAAPPPAGTVSVVVPARDEAGRLAPCLAGLRADATAHEVLVVDDRSCDDTAAVARAGGATVIDGAELPAGWAGKAWALEQGLRAATGDWVVFLDADTRPRPGLLRALVHAARDADLLSTGPRFRLDVALGRALRAEGARLAFVDAADLLEVEPYASARETWTGWGRSLVGPDVNPPLQNALDLATLWLTMALPLLRRRTPLDALLIAVRWAMLLALARSYRPRGAAFWLSPLADAAVLARLTQSAIRPTRTWRGRTYGPSGSGPR